MPLESFQCHTNLQGKTSKAPVGMPVSSIDTLFCMSSKSTDLDTILKFLLCFHMLSPTQGGFYSCLVDFEAEVQGD